ncbi:MAG: response regulator [Planctomycetota bacterium]
MRKDAVILVAEDDAGHFELVKRNLWLSCVENDILHFKDGQQVLDFLYRKSDRTKLDKNGRCVVLLDIRMPKVDGRDVLRCIKADKQLRKIPVIMLTTTDRVEEIDRCYELGCSFYMVKPVNYNKFMEAVENLGAFLSLKWLQVPQIDEADEENEKTDFVPKTQ